MSRCFPESIPDSFAANPRLEDAYRRGWNHGHGIACHNVPSIGDSLFVDDMGRVVVDAENIRDIHQSLTFAAESNSRQFSPFEFTAHEFNSADDESGDDRVDSESLWAAFDAGIHDSIFADLAGFDDEAYGIESAEGVDR